MKSYRLLWNHTLFFMESHILLLNLKHLMKFNTRKKSRLQGKKEGFQMTNLLHLSLQMGLIEAEK